MFKNILNMFVPPFLCKNPANLNLGKCLCVVSVESNFAVSMVQKFLRFLCEISHM